MTATASRAFILLGAIVAFCVSVPAMAQYYETSATSKTGTAEIQASEIQASEIQGVDDATTESEAVLDEAEPVIESMAPTEGVANEVLTEAQSTRTATELAAGSLPTDDGLTPEEAWDDEHGWRYGTDYLFPLTRGGGEAGLPTWGRIVLSPITVALDTGMLPFGALAGLFGD